MHGAWRGQLFNDGAIMFRILLLGFLFAAPVAYAQSEVYVLGGAIHGLDETTGTF